MKRYVKARSAFRQTLLYVACVLTALMFLTVCGADSHASAEVDSLVRKSRSPQIEKETKVKMQAQKTLIISVGKRRLSATLADNSSAKALADLLANGPIVITMEDYGHMEKVGDLGARLPTNDEHITTSAGDLILYLGNKFVLYYAPNTWSFTRLGKIDNVSADELKRILGKDDVEIELSLSK